MRHQNSNQRLARKPDQARLLLKNLVTSVILYESVRTTKKRAQVARALVDRVITVGKTQRTDLAIRTLATMLTDANASKKILEVLKTRYAKRSSGFTRMKPLGQRQGDGALLVQLSLVDSAAPVTSEKSEATPTKKKTATKS